MLDKIKAVVVGHAVADALGVPVEFASREELDKAPVIGMEGFGTYPVPAGSWSDDTSMSLCTLDALAKNGIDYDLVMQNFGRWYHDGEFTPTGFTFDVGTTCSQAINAYYFNRLPATECGQKSERSNGNGSLMRIHPIVLYLANIDISIQEKIEIVHTMSALTHAHERSKIGCGIYSFVLWDLLKNPTMSALKDGLDKANAFYCGNLELTPYQRLFDKTFVITRNKDIKSSGYIVDTLEAAIWCILTTTNYKDAVLKAVNLGEDTDTVAAIAGGLAGALYGYDAIPVEWRASLLQLDYIENLCNALNERLTADLSD